MNQRFASRLYILGASRRIVADLRERLFAHLETLPASFYARRRTGEIMSRAVNVHLAADAYPLATELTVMTISVVVALAGVGLATLVWLRGTIKPETFSELAGGLPAEAHAGIRAGNSY